MKVQTTDGKTINMASVIYHARRAGAYQRGCHGVEFKPQYTFEADAYKQGVEDTHRIRQV